MHTVYVYGTLRPGLAPPIACQGLMYDIGSFPGVKLGPDLKGQFYVEKITVDDERLAGLDRYEGYHPDDKKGSLYLRQPFLDGWIYEFNQPVAGRYAVVGSGDWLLHKNQTRGRAA